MTYMLNCFFHFAQPDSHPHAEEPCPSQVGIESERSVREDLAVVVVTSDKGERHPGRTERDCVILAQLYRTSSEPHGLGNLLLVIGRPATTLGLRKTTGCHGKGRCEVRVQVDGPGERRQRFGVSFSSPLMKCCQS